MGYMLSYTLDNFTPDKSFPFFIQYGGHTEDLDMHAHADFTELVIVLDGSATHVVDDESFPVNRGDVFVINSSTRHAYKTPKNFKICNIMYSPEFFFNSNLDITKSAGYHALFVLEPYITREHGFRSRLKLSRNDFEKIKELLTFMIDEYKKRSDGWQTIVFAAFLALTTALTRRYKVTSDSSSDKILSLANAVSYIENNFTQEISISELCALTNYSERHFIRIFSDTYQTTPLNYIITLRLNQAAKQLRSTNKSIAEISLQCGFSDSNYFSRAFRKKYRLSPSEYRKGPLLDIKTGF